MILKDSEINHWYFGTYTEIGDNCTEGDGYVIDNQGRKHELDWLYEEGIDGITHSGDFLKGYVFTWHVPRIPENQQDFLSLWKENFKNINRHIRKTNKQHSKENGRTMFYNSNGSVLDGKVVATLEPGTFGYAQKHFILEISTHVDNYLIIRSASEVSASRQGFNRKRKELYAMIDKAREKLNKQMPPPE